MLKCEEFILSYSLTVVKEVRCTLLAVISHAIAKTIETDWVIDSLEYKGRNKSPFLHVNKQT